MPRQQRTSAPFRSAPFCCSVVRGSRFSSRYEARVLKRRQVCEEISLRHFQLSSTKRRFPKTTVIMSSTKFWMKSTVWQSVCFTIRAHKRTKCQMFRTVQRCCKQKTSLIIFSKDCCYEIQICCLKIVIF